MADESFQHLITGGDNPLLPRLVEAINGATHIDFTVAFIRQTGLNLLIAPLEDALERGTKIRILTGDYLNITDPQALRQLLLLQKKGAKVRVFESRDDQSFHMKAYIFASFKNEIQHDGLAIVGSSNISYSALKMGLEWNLVVKWKDDPARFDEIRNKFNAVYTAERTRLLSHEWVDIYQSQVSKQKPAVITDPTEILEPVRPHDIQAEVLNALTKTRTEGFQRGLVVMATGLGKTWLAAFDTLQLNAGKVLFVAHREEILDQAESTFLRIRPNTKIGRYTGQRRELGVDMLFASVQTLGKKSHLDKFAPNYFDYIVIDEFHHAAARTYQRLLAHFEPKFLLGLTATPERTDQASILSLCDDNLVCQRGMKEGINAGWLCPFTYYGIADKHVNYQAIPWRSGKFDPKALYNQLATHGRAKHALDQWRLRKQERTLAFCVSKKHADFMADYFGRNGHNAVSVHSESETRRNEALTGLREGKYEIIFSVDLFNEGVDLPAIDTVMMLRPSESKIIFLQQLGRGLRTHKGKKTLVVLDFIGNHISFFRKFEALFQIGVTNKKRKEFIERLKNRSLDLPAGCFVNYDLKVIELLEELTRTQIDDQESLYRSLKDSLGRRPSLGEFFQAGGGVLTIRKEHGHWFKFVSSEGDLDDDEQFCLDEYSNIFLEVETTQLTKSYKMILLEALIKLSGFTSPVSEELLARESYRVLQRRRAVHGDLPEWVNPTSALQEGSTDKWTHYWQDNPINAWIGGNRAGTNATFSSKNGLFQLNQHIEERYLEVFLALLQELIDYRLSQYESRKNAPIPTDSQSNNHVIQIPYFTDLRIACGYFDSSPHEDEYIETITLPSEFGDFDTTKHFIARAKGDSMDGGEFPIRNGDQLLLELVTTKEANKLVDDIVAIEKSDEEAGNQYLLRFVKSTNTNNDGRELIANNPDYPTLPVSNEMRIFARLIKVIDPIDTALHKSFKREEIPTLFGMPFNPGLWNSGHIHSTRLNDQILFVTLNKQGKIPDQRYHDYFIDNKTFHWQSQAKTTTNSSKGQAIVNHRKNGSNVHLFVRRHKLQGNKSAPFFYCGQMEYTNHEGEKPMSVFWALKNPIPDTLAGDLGIHQL